MYEKLGTVRLKNGESVEMGCVKCPDPEWAERLCALLGHKGPVWRWQISKMLSDPVEPDVYFYVLHRDAVPFSTLATCEIEGVGDFGHVWTNEADRRKGAMSNLVPAALKHYRARAGKAYYLGTRYDSVAYHLYGKNGFRAIEDKSGVMEWYADSKEAFEKVVFAPGDLVIEDAGWKHLPTVAPLLLGAFPGVIRSAPLDLIGRGKYKGCFLGLLHAQEEMRKKEPEAPARAKILYNRTTNGVMGMATWTTWTTKLLGGNTSVVDVYCHPTFWGKGRALLDALVVPDADWQIAFSDSDCPEKAEVLKDAGFREFVGFEKRIPADEARTRFVDVTMFQR